MKTIRLSSLFGLATLLAAFSTSALAGPGLQHWLGTKPAAPAKIARSMKSSDTPAPGCDGCRTVAITEYRTALPNGRNIPHRVKVGTTHTCEHCAGEVTVVNGRTTDAMRHDDATCAATVSCCAVKT